MASGSRRTAAKKRSSGREGGAGSDRGSRSGRKKSGQADSGRKAASSRTKTKAGEGGRSSNRNRPSRSSSKKRSSGRTSSRRRPRAEGEDGFEEEIAPRRRVGPSPAPTALWVVAGLVGIGVIVSFFVMIASRRQTPVVVRTFDQDKLERVQALKREAEQHFRDAMRAMSDDRDPDRVRETHAALKKLDEAETLFMELTKPYRDEDGELPPKYQGHEEILGQIQALRHDIGKISPIDD